MGHGYIATLKVKKVKGELVSTFSPMTQADYEWFHKYKRKKTMFLAVINYRPMAFIKGEKLRIKTYDGEYIGQFVTLDKVYRGQCILIFGEKGYRNILFSEIKTIEKIYDSKIEENKS